MVWENVTGNILSSESSKLQKAPCHVPLIQFKFEVSLVIFDFEIQKSVKRIGYNLHNGLLYSFLRRRTTFWTMSYPLNDFWVNKSWDCSLLPLRRSIGGQLIQLAKRLPCPFWLPWNVLTSWNLCSSSDEAPQVKKVASMGGSWITLVWSPNLNRIIPFCLFVGISNK